MSQATEITGSYSTSFNMRDAAAEELSHAIWGFLLSFV